MSGFTGKWIGVDLDGTLAEYHGWKGPNVIGPPVPLMLARVKFWLEEGKDVRIFTARVAEPDPDKNRLVVEAIDEWCLEHVGRTLPVTNVKDYGMVELWDDRAVQIITNTGLRLDGVPDGLLVMPPTPGPDPSPVDEEVPPSRSRRRAGRSGPDRALQPGAAYLRRPVP